jgi:c-di-GMP-binding flagellar brake protein YcgR
MRYAKRKDERRKYLRLRVYHLVKYRVISDKSPQSRPLLASIKDIGAGGICLITDEPLEASANLELQINFPDVKKPIFTLGRVVWSRQIAKMSRYEVGIEFTDIEASIPKLIDDDVRFVYRKVYIRKKKAPKPIQ